MADPRIPLDAWDTLRWSLERSKCERDFVYLCEKYLRVKSKTRIGLPTLRFNAVQRHLHETCEDQLKRTGYIRKIYGKSRQVGSSTFFQAKTFHQTAFHDNRNALFLAHDEPSSIEIFGITKAYYDALPLALKPRTKYDARQKIEFIGRNSKILSAHAANINVAAGQMYHLVHMTEAARYPNPDKVQASLFPSISEARGEDHSMVVIESTSVFGGDWFKSFADAAARGENEYEFHFIPWFQHDAYTAAVPADFELTHEEREWRRKYGLTNGQIAWWRQMAAKYASNPSIMRSEFPFCLAASTRISTELGIIPLGEAISAKMTESGPILAWVPQGNAETWTAETTLGYSITGTSTHRLACHNEVTPFVELGASLGHCISLQPPRFAAHPCTIRWDDMPMVTTTCLVTPDIGRWLGYFMGDGSYWPGQGRYGNGAGGQISIACTAKDEDVVADVMSLSQRLFGVLPAVRTIGPNGGCREVRIYLARTFAWLQAFGLIHRVRTDTFRWMRHVHVLDAIWRSPQHVVREFLRGLFESDACAGAKGQINLFSKHRVFLQDVQLLLLGFGITCRLGKWAPNKGNGGQCLILRVAEAQRFRQVVGFVGKRKQESGAEVRRRRGKCSRIAFADRVISVVPAKEQQVFDLTLPAPHTFSANGLVVHNSWESSWVLPIGTLRVFTDKMMLDAARGVRPPEFRALATSGGLEKMLGGPVEVWEAPQPGVFYHAGIDLAEGRTEQADWSVGCVVRRDTLAQVAQFRVHENPASADFLDLVYWLGMTYNCAEINPDITGGWGNALLTELQYRNYPNIWRWRRRDDVKQRVSTRIGFLFTKRDKAHLVGNAVALATRGEVPIASETLLDEMRTYLNIGLDEWSAAPGAWDDAVTAWMLALLSARDERTSSGAPLAPDEVPVARDPAKWHNVDADLDDEEATALIRMAPWKG